MLRRLSLNLLARHEDVCMAGIESTGIDPLAEVIAINDSRILYHPLTFKHIEPKVYFETYRLFSVANIPKQKIHKA